ncbi:NAD(P)/FAD-dependent oxidoreductase [Hyphomonas sp.]|uniref:NAD(P)/FAD-dependent oxidoreductase n=1 Tax=Hyphomonas sp. TaxID=87 RepID=UPI0039197566
MTIAIIGAGMAGLAAAAQLTRGGRDVRLFDKGRGPGGRMATRRASLGGADIAFDHGAQYFTARSAGFQDAVADWVRTGAAAVWGDGRYVGTPAMNSVIKAMAAPLDVVWGAQVTEIAGAPGRWQLLRGEAQPVGVFEQVVVAVPAEQAAALLAPVAPGLAARAGAVRSAPCWTVMLGYEQPTGVMAEAMEPEAGPLGWAARNSSKPGRAGAESWVLQARPDWSAAHLEDPAETVAADLVAAFVDVTGAGAPDFVQAHRWRYARVTEPLGIPFQFDRALGLATCGDWHLGARIEAAWTSGHLLGRELLR